MFGGEFSEESLNDTADGGLNLYIDPAPAPRLVLSDLESTLSVS